MYTWSGRFCRSAIRKAAVDFFTDVLIFTAVFCPHPVADGEFSPIVHDLLLFFSVMPQQGKNTGDIRQADDQVDINRLNFKLGDQVNAILS